MLTFLDAHMECSKGWLEPILSRIAYDRSVVVVPNFDAISSKDMSYRHVHQSQIAGLRWHLVFNWYSYAHFIENTYTVPKIRYNFIMKIILNNS